MAITNDILKQEVVFINNYEKLQTQACQDGIDIIENYPFESDRILGLYSDYTIALSRNLKNTTEKSCVLAEEIGHHITSSGDIIDQTDISNRKQEFHARAWAYLNLIDLKDFIRAYKAGCRNRYELAEYLEVTEEFITDAIQFFSGKYGTYTNIGNYVIFFEPLGVLELHK